MSTLVKIDIIRRGRRHNLNTLSKLVCRSMPSLISVPGFSFDVNN